MFLKLHFFKEMPKTKESVLLLYLIVSGYFIFRGEAHAHTPSEKHS